MAPVQILPTWATCMGTQGVCEGMRVSVFQLLDVILIVLIQPMLVECQWAGDRDPFMNKKALARVSHTFFSSRFFFFNFKLNRKHKMFFCLQPVR